MVIDGVSSVCMILYGFFQEGLGGKEGHRPKRDTFSRFFQGLERLGWLGQVRSGSGIGWATGRSKYTSPSDCHIYDG